MTHDFSHLDEAGIRMFISEYCGLMPEHVTGKDVDAFFSPCPHHGSDSVYKENVKNAMFAAFAAYRASLTPSDLAAILTEKCPGWVAVYHEANDAQCKALTRLWLLSDQMPVGSDFRLAAGYWKKLIATAPKLGDE